MKELGTIESKTVELSLVDIGACDGWQIDDAEESGGTVRVHLIRYGKPEPVSKTARQMPLTELDNMTVRDFRYAQVFNPDAPINISQLRQDTNDFEDIRFPVKIINAELVYGEEDKPHLEFQLMPDIKYTHGGGSYVYLTPFFAKMDLNFKMRFSKSTFHRILNAVYAEDQDAGE